MWLSNTRGNRYSRNHTTLDPNILGAFWNFSFSTAGRKDLSAVIDYVLLKTGQPQVNYVGHSEGTSMLLALLATMPAYNPKIGIANLLAPIAYEQHIRIDQAAYFELFAALWVHLIKPSLF